VGFFKELDIESADAGRTQGQSPVVEPTRAMRTECYASELATEVAAAPLLKFDFKNLFNFAERLQKNPDTYSFLYW